MTEEEVKKLIAEATGKFTNELNKMKEENKKLTDEVAAKTTKVKELTDTITDLMLNGKNSTNEAAAEEEEKTPEELFLEHTDSFIKEKYAKRKEVNN
jgi:hypothetical protein